MHDNPMNRFLADLRQPRRGAATIRRTSCEPALAAAFDACRGGTTRRQHQAAQRLRRTARWDRTAVDEIRPSRAQMPRLLSVCWVGPDRRVERCRPLFERAGGPGCYRRQNPRLRLLGERFIGQTLRSMMDTGAVWAASRAPALLTRSSCGPMDPAKCVPSLSAFTGSRSGGLGAFTESAQACGDFIREAPGRGRGSLQGPIPCLRGPLFVANAAVDRRELLHATGWTARCTVHPSHVAVEPDRCRHRRCDDHVVAGLVQR